MPKAKLKVQAKDINRLKNALEFVDGVLVKEATLGTEIVATVSVKSNVDLFTLGVYLPLVSDKAPEVKASAPGAAKK